MEGENRLSKIIENGLCRELSEEEIAAEEQNATPIEQPTQEEVNAANIAYLAMMTGVDL